MSMNLAEIKDVAAKEARQETAHKLDELRAEVKSGCIGSAAEEIAADILFTIDDDPTDDAVQELIEEVIVEQRDSAKSNEAEVAQLDEAQRSAYYEAIDCGATHNDAMEAATTYGYTR